MAEVRAAPRAGRILSPVWLLERVRILSDEQVEALRQELARLLDAVNQKIEDCFNEYNSNESTDPNHVLFHALGAWRITQAFTTALASGIHRSRRRNC